jgi:2-aminoethylphosphonate-pyruvate transaminase
MTKLGFEPMLSHNLQAPIIVTFRTPADPNYDFEKFYEALRKKLAPVIESSKGIAA